MIGSDDLLSLAGDKSDDYACKGQELEAKHDKLMVEHAWVRRKPVNS